MGLGPDVVELGDAGDLAAVQRELTSPKDLGPAVWIQASFRALACVLRAPSGLKAVQALSAEDLAGIAGSKKQLSRHTELGKALAQLLRDRGDVQGEGFENLWAAVSWSIIAVESKGCGKILRCVVRALFAGEGGSTLTHSLEH